MYSSIPTHIIVYIPFLLVLISTPMATSSSALIDKICSTPRKDFSFKMCTRVLQSQPKIASATNLFDLSLEIMKSGIASSTKTRKHVESLLDKTSTRPRIKGALQRCNSSYDHVIVSMMSALTETEEKEYQTATYDLLLATSDNIQECEDAVKSEKIVDKVILSGNKLVKVFGLSGYEAVMEIQSHSTNY